MDAVRLTREFMLERFLARDAACNGRFLSGVTTTGIYCLPSCSARKPRPENVVFFDSEDAARRAGLRACRRCKPDSFLREHDVDLERLEAAVAALELDPTCIADVAGFANAVEVGATKLSELARKHFHATPLELLTRARLAAAERELANERVPRRPNGAEVAFAVGFESLSAFHDNFRRANGLAPGDWRELEGASEFEIALPTGFRADLALAFFGRDPSSPNERVTGSKFERVELFGDRVGVLRLEFGEARVRCRLDSRRALPSGAARRAHALVRRLLALADDPSSFERRVRRDRKLAPLIVGREGLRVPRSASAFEAATWTILAQQVNLGFAFACRRALLELAGEPLGPGRFAHPTPERVAALDYRDLERLKLSRSKAEYLVDLSRSIASGELDFERLERGSATRAERSLAAIRGLGPWSVQSILMRGFGFADCVPIGDAGLARSLDEFFGLGVRPDRDRTVELMRPFAPERSLASFHFWRRLGNSP